MRRLQLIDFRNYCEGDVALASGVTALVGGNGQGKTNVVEAIAYLATQTSHRVASSGPLIRVGAPRAVVRGAIHRDRRDVTVEVVIRDGKANRASVNRAAVPKSRDAVGILRVVVFAPEDLALVKGDPEGRRRFVDDLLVLRAPRFAAVRADYDRVLRQRNALLRNVPRRPGGACGATSAATLQVWDEQLATLGAQLLEARFYLLAKLAAPVAGAYADVSDGAGQAQLGYRCSIGAALSEVVTEQLRLCAQGQPVATPGRADLAAAIHEQLGATRQRELDRGLTLVGPHRDDLDLSLGGLPARGYASHGESWSMALALRLGSYALLRADVDATDGEPVLLLDDVFAELDATRRARLSQLIAPAEQVLVTAAVAADIPSELAGEQITVVDGQLLP